MTKKNGKIDTKNEKIDIKMKKIDKIDIKRQITKIEKLTKVVKQEQ